MGEGGERERKRERERGREGGREKEGGRERGEKNRTSQATVYISGTACRLANFGCIKSQVYQKADYQHQATCLQYKGSTKDTVSLSSLPCPH